MFHLNIKAGEELVRHFKWHFLGFSWGMWLLKCPRRRDLITDTMHPLCCQCDRNLYLSTLWALWMRWAQKSICIAECGFFKPHSLDGIWEIVHIFVHETVAPRWRTCFRHDLLVFTMLHSPLITNPTVEEMHKRGPAEISIALQTCLYSALDSPKV